MNEFYTPLETNLTDPTKYQQDVTATDPLFLEDDVLVEEDNKYKKESVPETNPSVPPNNMNRSDDNHESPPIIQHKINIPEVPAPSPTVFIPE